MYREENVTLNARIQTLILELESRQQSMYQSLISRKHSAVSRNNVTNTSAVDNGLRERTQSIAGLSQNGGSGGLGGLESFICYQ